VVFLRMYKHSLEYPSTTKPHSRGLAHSTAEGGGVVEAAVVLIEPECVVRLFALRLL
jgi:hypothetical protein